jgi:NAD(P)-dependent dehydrogenase (short-subunit alcohol dehydrogenase family)
LRAVTKWLRSAAVTGEVAMRNLAGKRAFVTGAGGGIGRAIALALARQGVQLFLVDINPDNLRASAHDADALGVRVFFKICDVSIAEEIKACAAACLSALGGLDILVNCAGLLVYGHVNEMRADTWDAVLAVNLMAPIHFARELLPALGAQGEGHILNVCSLLGLVPVRKLASYQTSKFGLVGFSLALRTAYSRYNIGVTALCPSFVDTPMLQKMGPKWFRQSTKFGPLTLLMSPEHVAERAISAIRRNRSIEVVPHAAKLVWFVYRIAPRFFVWLFSHRFRWRARQHRPQS